MRLNASRACGRRKTDVMAAKEHKARKENLAEPGCVRSNSRSNPGHGQGAAAGAAGTAAVSFSFVGFLRGWIKMATAQDIEVKNPAQAAAAARGGPSDN